MGCNLCLQGRGKRSVCGCCQGGGEEECAWCHGTGQHAEADDGLPGSSSSSRRSSSSSSRRSSSYTPFQCWHYISTDCKASLMMPSTQWRASTCATMCCQIICMLLMVPSVSPVCGYVCCAGAMMVGDTLFRSADGSSHCPICKGKVSRDCAVTQRWWLSLGLWTWHRTARLLHACMLVAAAVSYASYCYLLRGVCMGVGSLTCCCHLSRLVCAAAGLRAV